MLTREIINEIQIHLEVEAKTGILIERSKAAQALAAFNKGELAPALSVFEHLRSLNSTGRSRLSDSLNFDYDVLIYALKAELTARGEA